MPLIIRKFNAQVRDSNTGNMIPAGLLSSDALSVIEDAKDDAIEAVEDKGAETLASIPDDYSALSADVGELKTQFDDFIDSTFDEETIVGTNILPPDSVSGYWDITTGEAVEDASFSRSITSISVNTPGKIYITTENGFSTNKVIVLFMDENDDVLSYKQFSSDGSQSIPTGTIAIKVYINGVILTLDEVCLSYAQTTYVEYNPEHEYTLKDDALPDSLVSELNDLESDVSGIKEITDDFVHDESFFEDVTLLTKSDAQYTNGMWLTDGTIATTTAALNYDAIDMMDVIPGMSYRINHFYGFYTLFDSQGINGVNSEVWTSYTDVTFTVPNGKYKIGISVRANRFTSEFKFVRTTPTQEEINSYPLLLENFTLKPDNIASSDIIRLIAPLKGQKVVNFGDSIFGNYQANSGENMSISAMIAERTGMTAYNAGFGGCRMAQHPTSYWDAFSMYRLADSIASGDWSLQETALTDGGSNLPDYFPSTVAMLETIDWTEIDIITIGYGTNDFTGNITEQDFKDALSDSIETILTAYPNLKILVVSPMYRWYDNDDSDTHTNSNNDKLTDFCDWCKEEAELYHVPYVDTYTTLGINSINKLVYFFSTDGTHPNVNGRWLRANRISAKLLETM